MAINLVDVGSCGLLAAMVSNGWGSCLYWEAGPWVVGCCYRVNSRHVHTGEEAEPFLFHEIRVLHIHRSSSYIHRPQRLGP